MGNIVDKHNVSTLSLLFSSISSIIGSGWLFTCYYSAKFAGPSSILTWIIGGFLVTMLAFMFGELSIIAPVDGASARIPSVTHGNTIGLFFSFVTWISYVSITVIEVQAVIQYLSYYVHGLTNQDGHLLINGYIISTVLMLLISTINVYSIRLLTRLNNVLTVMKILIPLFISIFILMEYFSIDRVIHSAGSPFIPNGIRGIFMALISGGVIFAFNGFRQAAELSGRTKNPRKSMPIAIISSILICLFIFMVLQITFLSSINTENILNGWNNISLSSNLNASPLATIIDQDHLDWLLPILYTGAIIAPLAASMMYCNCAGYSFCGISKEKYLPKIFHKLSNNGNPIYAIAFNFIVGMCMFAPFPGWDSMMKFLTSLIVVSYCIVPISIITIRQNLSHCEHWLPKWFAYTLSIISFYVCTLLIYWSGWEIINKLLILLLIFVVSIFICDIIWKRKRTSYAGLHIYESIWLWLYFIGISVISYFGEFGGGHGDIRFGYDVVILAIFSLVVLYIATKYKLKKDIISDNFNKLMYDKSN